MRRIEILCSRLLDLFHPAAGSGVEGVYPQHLLELGRRHVIITEFEEGLRQLQEVLHFFHTRDVGRGERCGVPVRVREELLEFLRLHMIRVHGRRQHGVKSLGSLSVTRLRHELGGPSAARGCETGPCLSFHARSHRGVRERLVDLRIKRDRLLQLARLEESGCFIELRAGFIHQCLPPLHFALGNARRPFRARPSQKSSAMQQARCPQANQSPRSNAGGRASGAGLDGSHG